METITDELKEQTKESHIDTQDVPETENDKNVKKKVRSLWKCSVCNLEERYDYKGNNPPFSKHLTFHEECYIMKDPFSPPNRGEILTLGADCSVCENPVCMQCSLFYSKRFCKLCALKNINYFPTKLKDRIATMNKNDEEDF